MSACNAGADCARPPIYTANHGKIVACGPCRRLLDASIRPMWLRWAALPPSRACENCGKPADRRVGIYDVCGDCAEPACYGATS